MSSLTTLGFACAWDPNPRATWSYTPWNLREALRSRTHVVDVGFSLPIVARRALKLAYTRRRGRHFVSTWKHSGVWDSICQGAIAKRVQRATISAVLEIQDLARLDLPFFLYQDASYDVLLHLWQNGTMLPHYPMLDRDTILRRRERQHRIYEQAAGVLSMSAWFARSLVELTGLPNEKVHVVQPGANILPSGPIVLRATGPRRRLLLVGKDFHTKAGDVVVAALAILRRNYDPAVTLTVAGPRRWPQPGAIPAGVRFLGRLPAEAVGHLYDTHDLFVMPSRFEGFGIAFVEALASGLPCIGRNAFAMPELISPGRNGDLVSSDDPNELADTIVRVLSDDDLYVRCAASATQVTGHFTWERAADDALTAIERGLSGAITGGIKKLA